MVYTLYYWTADNEGGYGACKLEDFTPMVAFHPESGWRARPPVKIGEFSSLKELYMLLRVEYSDIDSDEYVLMDATDIWEDVTGEREY